MDAKLPADLRARVIDALRDVGSLNPSESLVLLLDAMARRAAVTHPEWVEKHMAKSGLRDLIVVLLRSVASMRAVMNQEVERERQTEEVLAEISAKERDGTLEPDSSPDPVDVEAATIEDLVQDPFPAEPFLPAAQDPTVRQCIAESFESLGLGQPDERIIRAIAEVLRGMAGPGFRRVKPFLLPFLVATLLRGPGTHMKPKPNDGDPQISP